ncbi:MAG: metallophosphoesterase [Ruminococcus sp.]|nr:metallophosphoesterase [Ruminococcus sp.]
MRIFTIADLHLPLGVNKPMDIFGGWDDYVNRLHDNWQKIVSPQDIVVVPGDISWALKLEQTLKDFEFINALNGTKVFIKGNHDLWWSTRSKVEKFWSDNGFGTLHLVQNDCYRIGESAVCGTRGWINDDSEPADAKVIAREAIRLDMSIASAVSQGLRPIVFLHYPPLYANNCNLDILEVLHKYNISHCFYGHLHGNTHAFAINGTRDGITYQLISADFLQFAPMDITKIVQNDKT